MRYFGAITLAAAGGELFLKGVLGTAGAQGIAQADLRFARQGGERPNSVVATSTLGTRTAAAIRLERRELGRNFVLSVTVPILTLWFVRDSSISRGEGGVLLVVFLLWLALLIRSGLGARASEAASADGYPWRSLLLAATGLVALVALVVAGRLFVFWATALATAFGVDAFIIGATLVVYPICALNS